jgi:hypothetical protein
MKNPPESVALLFTRYHCELDPVRGVSQIRNCCMGLVTLEHPSITILPFVKFAAAEAL